MTGTRHISEYIEYCISSFGQLPTGFGPPLGLTDYVAAIESKLKYLHKTGEISYDKADRIKRLIDKFRNPTIVVETTDIRMC